MLLVALVILVVAEVVVAMTALVGPEVVE